MKYGNSVGGGYDDSRFTNLYSVACERARNTGEDVDVLISILKAKNPNVGINDEVTELSIKLPNDWYGFYNEETGVGDYYVGIGRGQAQKGQIPEDVREYNKAKLKLKHSIGGLDTIKSAWNAGVAWLKALND